MQKGSGVINLQTEFNYLNSFTFYRVFTIWVSSAQWGRGRWVGEGVSGDIEGFSYMQTCMCAHMHICCSHWAWANATRNHKLFSNTFPQFPLNKGLFTRNVSVRPNSVRYSRRHHWHKAKQQLCKQTLMMELKRKCAIAFRTRSVWTSL